MISEHGKNTDEEKIAPKKDPRGNNGSGTDNKKGTNLSELCVESLFHAGQIKL